MNDYISKPFSRQRLQEIIDCWLSVPDQETVPIASTVSAGVYMSWPTTARPDTLQRRSNASIETNSEHVCVLFEDSTSITSADEFEVGASTNMASPLTTISQAHAASVPPSSSPRSSASGSFSSNVDTCREYGSLLSTEKSDSQMVPLFRPPPPPPTTSKIEVKGIINFTLPFETHQTQTSPLCRVVDTSSGLQQGKDEPISMSMHSLSRDKILNEPSTYILTDAQIQEFEV